MTANIMCMVMNYDINIYRAFTVLQSKRANFVVFKVFCFKKVYKKGLF